MIIITTTVHQLFTDTLQKKGVDFLYQPGIKYQDLSTIIHQATGLIISTQINVDDALIDKAISLKWIGRMGSGMEHVNVAYAETKGIACYSSPEGNRNAVAEHALGMLLSLMRNIHKSSEEVKQFIWKREENRGVELSGKVIGIIGYGHTGSSFARLLSSFDVTILAYDKYKTDIDNAYVKSASLEAIFQYADVVSFHLPLSEETHHFGNNDFFGSVQRQPYILNTSRGSVIDTGALIRAIESKKIAGAALDVLENEQLATFTTEDKAVLSFLVHQENVIITPHIAGYSHEATYKMSAVMLEKLGFLPLP
jgi:D-3-phosphoglycerate dehydrogenase